MKYYGIEIFKRLDHGFEQKFIKYGQIVSYQRRDTPFLDGELERFFYIVLKGKIKTFQINLENSKEQTIFIYRTGDMFDTIILLDGEPHDIMYEVIEDIELLELPIDKVREWLNSNEQFKRHFFPYIASQMRRTEELATDLSLLSTSERLLKILLRNINPNDKYYQLLQNLSKTEIAKLIGTVRNVIERHLKDLEEKDIIKNQRKNIYVKDIKRLLQESNQLLLT